MVSSCLPDHVQKSPLFMLVVHPPEPPHFVTHIADGGRATTTAQCVVAMVWARTLQRSWVGIGL
jgi:hypothetical protein